MFTVKLEAGSLSAAIANLKNLERDVFDKASRAALEAAGRELQAGLLKNVTRTDYSLQDLANMDHPYARRHGSIRIHSDRPYVVHKQSGLMSSNISGKTLGNASQGYRYRVGFNYGAVRYAKFVVQGTKYMLARDVVYRTSQEPAVRKAMMRAVVRVLGPKLRTGAGVRFG